MYFKDFIYFYIMYLNVFPVCEHHWYAYCFQGPEEGIRSPITGVRDGCEPPCQCWDLNIGLLQE